MHEEIDSASFFPQSRQGLPGAGASAQQGSLSPNRATSGPSQTQSPLSPLGNDRAPDFSSASRGPSSYHRTGGALHSPPADNSLPAALSGPTSQFNSRGPSPILPPIRDLHSLSDRNLKRLGTNPEDNLGSRPSSFVSNFPSASREAGYAYGSTPLSAREEERPGGSQPFAGGGAPQAYYNQPPYESSHYVHYPGTHSNESNYSPNVQTSPPSNFGVMSDPMDSRSRRRRGNLPKPVTDILRAWFHEHLDHPYPSEEDKQIFMSRTGLSISQVSAAFFLSPSFLLWIYLRVSSRLIGGEKWIWKVLQRSTKLTNYFRSVIGSLMQDDGNFPLFAIRYAIMKGIEAGDQDLPRVT